MLGDAETEKYLRIGERNLEVIQLVHNWCAHARVVSAGGVGLIEQMSGLPIGMRRVTCAFERAPSSASMHMQVNALDFYDRNCVGCPDRQPVRLPNLMELVRERDAAQAAREDARVAQEAAATRALEDRIAQRAAMRAETTSETASVLDLVDAFDSAPSTAAASLLFESARAVPGAFVESIVRHVAGLADVGGEARTAGALGLLDALDADYSLSGAAALRALARGEGGDVAADLATKALRATLSDSRSGSSAVEEPLAGAVLCTARGPDWAALLEAALPAIIAVSEPDPGWSLGSKERAAKRELVCAAFVFDRDSTAVAVRRALRAEFKGWRTAGAFSVVWLLDAYGPDAVIAFVPDVIAGFAQPDDRDDRGDAAHVLAWALAEILDRAVEKVDAALARAASYAGARERLGILLVYVAALEVHDRRTGLLQREGGRLGRSRSPTATEALAYRRILDVVARLPDEREVLQAAESILRHGSNVPVALERDAAQTLLGIAALAAEASQDMSPVAHTTQPVSPAVPEPPALRELQAQNRRMELRSLADSVMAAFLRAASDATGADRRALVDLLCETFTSAPEHAEQFRATLVEHAGGLAADASTAALILPVLYRAMMDRSQLVRAASVQSYEALVDELGAESLPTLVHETFLVLLADPYVIVHRSALRVLADVKLPEACLAEAVVRVGRLVSVYADGTTPDALHEALRAWVRVLRHAELLTDGRRAAIIRLAGKLPHYLADGYVKRGWMALRGAAGYSELVVKLLADPETFETSHEPLLDELEALGAPEIQRLAASIVAAGRSLLRAYPRHLERLLQILADADARTEARQLAEGVIVACGDTRDRRPRKLRAQLAAALIDVEASAAAGDPPRVAAAVEVARAAAAAIAADDEENRERRGIGDIQRLLNSASLGR